MENILYEIEDHEDNVQKMDKHSTKSYLKDFADDVKSIKKTYKYSKTVYRMTLFSLEHDFLAQDYIDHYKSLSSNLYGKDFMSEFDVFIIRKFNE